jgi:diadenosine tetraphosphate (Ap4A) HIT family hydrolase
MPTLIHERVRMANAGANPYVIARLASGWAVVGDVQPLPGYCLLLPDPVVKDLNSLPESERTAYSLDALRIGDALLQVTDSYRINYETWGNSDQALHTHIMPRYLWEADAKRKHPACMGYSWGEARRFDANFATDMTFIEAMRRALRPHSL